MAFPEYRKPIKVDGGIKARNKSGSIGERWWSRRFIDVVESFGDSGRLARGRTYARKGQVLELTVGPYEVSAKVQGSDPDPYEVTLGIDVIDEPDWADIEEALASRAVFRAQLLAGDMPHEIESVFAEFGIPLFPKSGDDLHMMCDCMDWGDPCKHTAAVLYVLAEAFDDDPFLVLAWNGRTKEELLTALRRQPPAAPPPVDVKAEPLSAEHFWTPATGLARLRERRPAPAVPPGLLLQLLDPPKVKIRRRDLTDVLGPVYEALADSAQRDE
jgi:uncharacterized Zn finger protein